MRRVLPVLTLALLCAGSARAQGLLIPTQTDVPPLAMRSHEVSVTVEDQVAVTKVVQTFRNDTDRALEASYVFPVPKGASVRKFTMWVDGKEVPGELVESDKARQIYTDVVRRAQDPGLLEYVGNNLLRVRVFPVPARGDQKLAVSYTSVANSDAGLIEYVYPLRAGAQAVKSMEKFTLDATLKAQHPIQNVYSPTHPVTVTRVGDRHAKVHFEASHTALDKDFQLYYTAGSKDVGLTALLHRPRPSVPDGGTVISGARRYSVPATTEDGYFMMLISPRAELTKTQEVPRDMVFVLDTSGSMQGRRIQQARNALKYCLKNLGPKDRFGLIHFATTVNKYNDHLQSANALRVLAAERWVDNLEAAGSTNINDALAAALEMRPDDAGRCFTIVFFTDGQPTIGETNVAQIVKNVVAKNTANTRIFTFGVGDDVNAVLLDQLADKTRSVSTYVRESEDIEAKVSSLYGKISHPVLTNLKLKVGGDITLSEVYPPQLPDLFHGTQLVVLGRYRGHGHAAVTLTGTTGHDSKEFVYEVKFPAKTNGDKAFVEDLWARRKVGYLLDQIRTHGENAEVKGEVVRLAKKYGITTPYTSYLVVPDGPTTPVARATGLNPQSLTVGDNIASTQPRLPAAVPTRDSLGYEVPPPPVVNPAMFGDALMEHGGLYAAGETRILKTTNTMGSSSGAMPAPAPSAVPAGAAPRIQFAPVFVAPTMQSAVPADCASSAPTAEYYKNHGYQIAGAPSNGQCVDGLFRGGAADLDEEQEEEAESSPAKDSAAQRKVYDQVRAALQSRAAADVQSGKLGVDLSIRLSDLRNQSQLGRATTRQAAGRTCVKFRGAWVDEGYETKMKAVTVKAMSAAYFRILERQPQMREVFQMGNRVLWVTPCGTALAVDPGDGREEMTDAEIDALFVATN
jgi:Ca-activated chloride channel family protein